jgi:hypothetical protein
VSHATLDSVFSPLAVMERIDRRLDRSGECWLWTGGVNNHGYGQINVRGRMWLVHRFVHALLGGSIDDEVLHTCDNPRCVRPAHLVSGTHADNMADAAKKGRMPGRAKLSRLQVEEIRTSAWDQADTAAAFGVSQSTVSRIRRLRTWR